MRAIKTTAAAPLVELNRPTRQTPTPTQPSAPATPVQALKVQVHRRIWCYWQPCHKPATHRVSFTAPSLLEGERPRDYCHLHAASVTAHPGARVTGRLQLVAAGAR